MERTVRTMCHATHGVLEVVTDAGRVGDPARITRVDEVLVERLVERHRGQKPDASALTTG
jgi:hypothetical protein